MAAMTRAISYAQRALEIDPEFVAAEDLIERAQGSRKVLASYPAVHTSLVPIPDTSRSSADLARLREAVRMGDMDAAAALRDILAEECKHDEAATLQHQIILQDPRRIEDVARLLELAGLAGQTTLEAMADWLQRAIESLPSGERVIPPVYWPPPPPFSRSYRSRPWARAPAPGRYLEAPRAPLGRDDSSRKNITSRASDTLARHDRVRRLVQRRNDRTRRSSLSQGERKRNRCRD